MVTDVEVKISEIGFSHGFLSRKIPLLLLAQLLHQGYEGKHYKKKSFKIEYRS